MKPGVKMDVYLGTKSQSHFYGRHLLAYLAYVIVAVGTLVGRHFSGGVMLAYTTPHLIIQSCHFLSFH